MILFHCIVHDITLQYSTRAQDGRHDTVPLHYTFTLHYITTQYSTRAEDGRADAAARRLRGELVTPRDAARRRGTHAHTRYHI